VNLWVVLILCLAGIIVLDMICGAVVDVLCAKAAAQAAAAQSHSDLARAHIEAGRKPEEG
jgi:hypothetical protein